VIGTAVRATGTTRPPFPFTCDLAGREFATLLRAGWVPVAYVQGVGAVTTHRDINQFDQDQSLDSQELVGPTKLVREARHAARTSLERHAAKAGAHTVVLQQATVEAWEADCTTGEGEDRFVNAFLGGTAIVPYADRPRRPLPILSLNR
jgi:hypothetical protein